MASLRGAARPDLAFLQQDFQRQQEEIRRLRDGRAAAAAAAAAALVDPDPGNARQVYFSLIFFEISATFEIPVFVRLVTVV